MDMPVNMPVNPVREDYQKSFYNIISILIISIIFFIWIYYKADITNKLNK